ncbi:MAG: hypothetical protein KKE30_07065 [Gammaproteobacteria bacterium]|nr:hypothetical protein [Gammaproteobacteria bacterium]MBU1556234.1 hypothetical protein [Gammaproteobacteria bacterium]MBU2071554.1 hypothetical protein [Gammaproteobacteria bacterium]MBU2184044.1 hypothetical protein [Gammaproteobacteria bacterium]MBU2206870.1 hypothetical protein [Gammaproteobacteria bacterium]
MIKQKMAQHYIETDGAVFCVAFSPDGLQLAAGTGSFYGAGQLMLLTLNTLDNSVTGVNKPQCVSLNQQKPHHKTPDILARPQGVSATALYFTPDNQQLWVATSASRREQGPLFCFELSNGGLQLPVPITMPSMNHQYPDGFVHSGNQLFICGHSMSGYSEGYICHLDITSDRAQYSSSSKLLLIDDQLITPGKPQPTLVQGSRPDKHSYQFGLSFAPATLPEAELNQLGTKMDQESAPPVFMQHKASNSIPVEHAILCLAQQPGKAHFNTGNAAGQLHHWWFEGQWHNRLISPEKVPEPTKTLLIKDSIFAANCVVAMQYLPDNQGWLSLHANGLLLQWRDDEIVQYAQVSDLGTPRCMALHPTLPLLAIGLKHNSELQGAGIVLLDISNWSSGC